MTRVRVPLLSFTADGRVGKSVVFITTKGRTHVRKRAEVPDQRTNLQLAQRSWFQQSILAWHELTDAQKQEYALVNPKAWPNPAYQNFMKEWLVGTVPVHHEDHEAGKRDQLALEDIESSQVGVSAQPQLNFVPTAYPFDILSLDAQDDVPWSDGDVTTVTSTSAVAALLWIMFMDTGGSPGSCGFRKKTDTNVYQQQNLWASVAGAWHPLSIIVGLDAQQKFQYTIDASGLNTAYLKVRLFGYFEPSEV